MVRIEELQRLEEAKIAAGLSEQTPAESRQQNTRRRVGTILEQGDPANDLNPSGTLHNMDGVGDAE